MKLRFFDAPPTRQSKLMRKLKPIFLCTLLLILSLPLGCEKTIDEEVLKPIEGMHNQKDEVVLKAAVANAQQVRGALMIYAAVSAGSGYPGDTQVYDYSSLREILSSESLPQKMADLKWDPASGFEYSSDGASFAFRIRAMTGKKETITATESGVSWR